MLKFVFLFFFFCINCYSITPIKDYIYLPTDYGVEFNEFSIEMNDYNLCVWDSRPKNITKSEIILLAYGDYGNMSYYLSYIKLYTDLGYRVISFDYRGFGQSSHLEIDKYFLYYEEFVKDLDNMILYCKKDLKIDKLAVVALSMGTLLTSLSTQKNNIDFLILENAVYNVNDILFRLNNEKKIMYKLPKNQIQTPLKWNDINCKMIIFAGEDDKITTKNDAFKISNYNKPKRKMVLYKGGHLSALNTDDNREIYLKEIKLFFNE